MTKKLPVSGGMQVSAYEVLHRAIEEGIERGWRRAYKYTDKPEEANIKEELMNCIMSEICEFFKFDDIGRDGRAG